MKKLLLIVLSVPFALMAQQAKIPTKISEQTLPYTKAFKGDELSLAPIRSQRSVLAAKTQNILDTINIGTTTYDLQSNASIQNRIFYNPANGEVVYVWTGSTQISTNWPDRGTFYNRRSGGNWGPKPTARIETSRTGWPSYVRTANGAEHIFAHTGTSILYNTRATAGTGSWSSSTVPGGIQLWNRATAGGTNGNTIHLIGLSDAVYPGYGYSMLYNRSTNAGNTWDKQGVIIPGTDSGDVAPFSGDSYAITARGNTVAIAVFRTFANSFILKSTNNGDTWTKTVFLNTGLGDKYNSTAAGSISDVNNDGIPDTIRSTDNYGAVYIDANGTVHVAFGIMRHIDSDPTAGQPASYFPVTDGLGYWKEGMTTFDTIAFVVDYDNDGFIPVTSINQIARYFASLSSMPTFAEDSLGNIFVAYSSLYELEKDFDDQFYRRIYVVRSNNGGLTWSAPIALNNNFQFAECVFPNLASPVNNKFRIAYQSDISAGLAVRGDLDPEDVNQIVYQESDTIPSQAGISDFSMNQNSLIIYPNPVKIGNNTQVVFNNHFAGNYLLEIADITGKVVKAQSLGFVGEGKQRVEISTADLAAGIYLVNIRGTHGVASQRLVIR